MTALVAEASDGLRDLALPIAAGDRVKAQIARAARKAGLPYWRAFDLWYRKAKRVGAEELDAIRAARARRAEDRSYELACLATDFEALAQRVAALAPGAGRADAVALRALAGRARDLAAGGGR